VLAERSTGQFVRLTASQSYWRRAQDHQVVYRVFSNADAQLRRFGRVTDCRRARPGAFNSLKNTEASPPAGDYSSSTSWPSTPGPP
jgi:hypothetical protein